MIQYAFTQKADQELQKFPIQNQKFIIKKIRHYCSAPDPLHFADSIEGERGKVYRFRIGDFRAVFDWRGSSILVTKIDNRKDVYR